MAFDFKGYSVYDLAFFYNHGPLSDSTIAQIGDHKQIRREVLAYVQKQPQDFRREFQRASELERKSEESDEIDENDEDLRSYDALNLIPEENHSFDGLDDD